MFKKLSIFLSLIFCVLVVPFSVGCSCDSKKHKVSSYNIDVELKDDIIKGNEQVTFYNSTDNAFSELKFNIYPNAFRKGAKYFAISNEKMSVAYQEGVNYGYIQIESVKSGENDIDFSISGIDENILLVPLQCQVYPDESITINIAFTVNLAKVNARTGITEKGINLGNFYPILCGIEDESFYECVYYSNGDPFYSDIANYNVNITLSNEYKIASTGRQVSCNVNGENKKVTITAENVRSFSMVVSKDFSEINRDVLGVDVHYLYYDDDDVDLSFSFIEKAIKTFSEIFGNYPYSTFTVCKARFFEGGMEYPQMVMISDSLERNSYNEVIVHETAHQWWQTAVGTNEIKYSFIDEGLAEYSTVLFYEKNQGLGMTRESMIKSTNETFKIFCSVYDKLYKKVNTAMVRNLNEFSSDYEYVNIAYIKSCLMFETLRKTIGDEKFFMGLRNFYSENIYKNVTPDNLITAFIGAKADVNGFFDTFFSGKEII